MNFLRLRGFYQLGQKTFSSTKMRKAPGGGKGDKTVNQEFVDFLFELSNYEKNVNRNTFKSNAYRKVGRKIDERFKILISI